MSTLPPFDQWQIWQVVWKHADDGTSKPRPALLLTTSAFNAGRSALPFLKISSSTTDGPHKVALDSGERWFPATGLRKDCFIHLAKPQWVPLGDILLYRGELQLPASVNLDMRIRLATGWAPK